MAGVEQPTNPTAPRPLVQGEAGAMEEQMAGAPLGPEQRGRPPAPPQMEAPAPMNDGRIASVQPGEPQVQPRTARPSSVEEQIGVAMLGLGSLSAVGRRFAMALSGFPQSGVVNESIPRMMGGETVIPPEEEQVLPEEAEPMPTSEVEEADQMVAEAVSPEAEEEEG